MSDPTLIDRGSNQGALLGAAVATVREQTAERIRGGLATDAELAHAGPMFDRAKPGDAVRAGQVLRLEDDTIAIAPADATLTADDVAGHGPGLTRPTRPTTPTPGGKP